MSPYSTWDCRFWVLRGGVPPAINQEEFPSFLRCLGQEGAGSKSFCRAQFSSLPNADAGKTLENQEMEGKCGVNQPAQDQDPQLLNAGAAQLFIDLPVFPDARRTSQGHGCLLTVLFLHTP